MALVAERSEAVPSYQTSMSLGTQGSYRADDLERSSQYRYLSVLREPSGDETTYSFVVEPDDFWARTQLLLLVSSALMRTQGSVPDEVRLYLGPVACRLGRPTAKVEAGIAEVVRSIRVRSGLPASEVAHMLGVQRRQLYKILEGGSTTPEREARILAIDEVLNELSDKYDSVAMVRSCLLAPLDEELRSFVDLAAEGDVRAAWRALADYLEQRGDRPVPQYIERPSRSKRRRDVSDFVCATRDITPGR